MDTAATHGTELFDSDSDMSEVEENVDAFTDDDTRMGTESDEADDEADDNDDDDVISILSVATPHHCRDLSLPLEDSDQVMFYYEASEIDAPTPETRLLTIQPAPQAMTSTVPGEVTESILRMGTPLRLAPFLRPRTTSIRLVSRRLILYWGQQSPNLKGLTTTPPPPLTLWTVGKRLAMADIQHLQQLPRLNVALGPSLPLPVEEWSFDIPPATSPLHTAHPELPNQYFAPGPSNLFPPTLPQALPQAYNPPPHFPFYAPQNPELYPGPPLPTPPFQPVQAPFQPAHTDAPIRVPNPRRRRAEEMEPSQARDAPLQHEGKGRGKGKARGIEVSSLVIPGLGGPSRSTDTLNDDEAKLNGRFRDELSPFKPVGNWDGASLRGWDSTKGPTRVVTRQRHRGRALALVGCC
ncbi:hypothetical protein BDY19DRAFT_908354 [Irpex rosettiformis]|uniref:Uncharacterized protein n=1 Tax=Irpex rosettiformis TaxID=378272 RepID=A0ACB8TWF3_9APHY|nr:hypothetical protein BDY19DRAFT_908354 [Irpex rosettiformis]